jgi:hypothetical protein
MGPLGVPTAIIAAIRVGGSPLLKGLIGRARESKDSIERDLKSSTSKEVCELWDGHTVVRLTAANPIIQELIYLDGEWYNLEDAKSKNLLTKKGGGDRWFLGEKSKIESVENAGLPGTGHSSQQQLVAPNISPSPTNAIDLAEDKDKDKTIPPNISLNLTDPKDRSWELGAAAISGILLQFAVLVIAGLTTFYPDWNQIFSIKLYEFYCMVAGTVSLTVGLIICVSVVDQSTEEEVYEVNDEVVKVKGKEMHILCVQRGRSDTDQSFKPCIFIAKGTRRSILTSRCPKEEEGTFNSSQAWTLIGILATMLGFIVQFIGLVGMHWPTQVAQFAVTLIMTGVEGFHSSSAHTASF